MAKVGKYELVRKLATGETYEVFLAKLQWARGLEKTLVVKRVLTHLTEDPDFVEQFSASARLSTQLNHPNIAQVLEFGESEGVYYIVMEYVDGPSLRSLAAAALAGGGIPFACSARIVTFCCEALAYAHELTDAASGEPLSLVQRDVTPDNILVSRAGAVKLVDFGIAKMTTQSQRTKSVMVKGKLAYMSPEQLRAEPMDRRSDVYSLGMVLYELVAGAKPYDAKSDVVLAHAMLFEEMIPLRTRRPDVPPELERIVNKALERDRDRRYPDCRAMHADLEEYLVLSRQAVSVLQLAQLVEKYPAAPGKPRKRAAPPTAPSTPPPPKPPPAELPPPPETTSVTKASARLRELLQPQPAWDDGSTEKTQPQMVVEIPPPPVPEKPPAPPEAVRPARQPPDSLRWDVVEEHLDEASFLHGQWEEALRSPGYTLAAVAASPERRLLGHLEGLVLGGPRVAERLLAPALAGDEPGTVFAAAFALLGGGRPADFEALIAALEKGDPVQRAAICRAMAVVPRADLGQQIVPLIAKAKVPQVELLEVLGQLRLDPGLPLEPLASSRKSSMAVLALRLAQVFSSRLDPAAVERAYASPVPEVCAAGLETGLMIRSREAFAACESAVEARSPGFGTAALLLGLSGDDKSVTTLLQALGDEDFQRDVAFALGFSGRVSAAGPLLEAMEDAALAPLAAEAFAAITGLRVEHELAVRPGRWGPEVKADGGVEQSRSEAALPQPDPEEIARWWKEARPKLDPARRWLRGQRWSAEALLDELEHGPARRREALALDVAIRTRGQVQISWNGLSGRQHRDLGEARTAQRNIHEGSYRDFNRRRP